MKTHTAFPSPQELDRQAKIIVDEWLEVESDLCRQMDDNYLLTKKIIKLGFQEPAYLFADSNGRLWGRGEDDHYYPFHFIVEDKVIGYRLSKKAAN
jgi:hypothetical protein